MTALALRDDQDQWDAKQLAVLHQTGIDEDVTEAELMAFLHECQRRKLDPFTRQIYLIGRKDKSKGRKVYRSQTSIDGFRLIARRAADKSGIDYSYEDTIWFDGKGQRYEIWLGQQPPSGAKVVVVRNGQRFDAVARYGAYVQTDWDGNPLKQWRTMPDVMIAKCAEALALRKAFPEDLGGIYTEEEMGQADNPQRVQATVEVVRDERPAPAAAAPPDDGWPGVDQAKKAAASFRTEAAATRLWKATVAAHIAGKCTTDEQDHIQNIITARIHDRRKEAATEILQPLGDDDEWRLTVWELTNVHEAGAALDELGRQKAAGQLDEARAELLGRAVIALFPKAAVKDQEAAA